MANRARATSTNPRTSVKPEERRRRLLRIFEEEPGVKTSSLGPRLGVSEGTVRSDLIALEERGNIRRRHGGVILVNSSDRASLVGPTLEFSGAARQIAERALSLIEPGDQIFLDHGRSCEYIALHLPPGGEVSVVTNSIRVAATLAWRGYSADVYVLPGILRTADLSIDVKLREIIAKRILLTKAFLSFPAYAADRGFFVESQGRVETVSLLLSISEGFYPLIESTGIRRRDNYLVPIEGHLSRLREIIIDFTPELERTSPFPATHPVALCGPGYVVKSPFNRQYVVGFSSLSGGHEFPQSVRRSIEEAVRRRTDVELLITDNRMDPEMTLRNVDTFIDNKADLVIEYSLYHRMGPLIAEKLSHSGIPLLAVDIPIPGAVYFGANNYQAGRIAGEAAAREVRARWNGLLENLVVLTETAAGPVAESRVTGMLEAFLRDVSYERARIVTVDSPNDAKESELTTREAIAGFRAGQKTLVFCFNSEVAAGAIAALRGLGLEKDAILVSANCTPGLARELARKGSPLLGAVDFFPELYGERILEIALRLLRKEPVNPQNYTEHRWIGRQD